MTEVEKKFMRSKLEDAFKEAGYFIPSNGEGKVHKAIDLLIEDGRVAVDESGEVTWKTATGASKHLAERVALWGTGEGAAILPARMDGAKAIKREGGDDEKREPNTKPTADEKTRDVNAAFSGFFGGGVPTGPALIRDRRAAEKNAKTERIPTADEANAAFAAWGRGEK